MKNKKALIIGAGLTGATVARCLADSGFDVTVWEMERYVGGTVADYKKDGYFVQRHGPHLFHTNSDRAYEFMSRFTEWFEYRHSVRALVDGKYIPIPFNFTSLEMLYRAEDAKKIERKLVAAYGSDGAVSISEMRENSDPVIKEFAEKVYKTVFEYYSSKQWGMDMSKADPAVLKRVPVRISYVDGYFSDKYQVMPTDGFSVALEKMLDCDNIRVETAINAINHLEIIDSKLYVDKKSIDHPVVYTGCIDELFGKKYGALPYRTLRLDFEEVDRKEYQPYGVVNYTVSEDFTRISEFKKFTARDVKSDTSVIVREYPLAYEGQTELSPYYPLPTSEARELFDKYANEAAEIENLYLAGRLGKYVYVNMDRAIDDALSLAQEIISKSCVMGGGLNV